MQIDLIKMSDLNNFVIVESDCGPVKGDLRKSAMGDEFVNFLGIPYMKAPIGELRFRAPEPREKWTEVFDATKDCPQYKLVNPFDAGKVIGEDDAGCLNIFTKNIKPAKPYPVMVYIHGGGFQTGSSYPTSFYGPDFIMQKDVVLVSINYRVGAIGFLSLDDPSLKVPGNSGLKDQVFALKWIRRNISAFGGNPDDVTLFGTSAGGASVHYHLLSDQSKGLFHRAMAMSGTSLNTSWAFHQRRNYALRIAKAMGYKGEEDDKSVLAFLEAADVSQVVLASEKIVTDEEKYGEQKVFSMGPVIEPYVNEGTFLPKHPIEMGESAWSKDIDVIFGGTSHEGLLMNMFTKDDDKFFTYLQDPVYFAPLIDLNLKPNDEMAQKIGKKLKKLYYGCTLPYKMNKEGYFLHSGDFQFWTGINRAVLQRIHYGGRGKTFLYRFDAVTSMNYLKDFFSCHGYEGCEHAGDIAYLFKVKDMPVPKEGSIELEVLQKVIEIFTSFATKSFNNWKFDKWEPVTSAEYPLKGFNITADECKFVELPENERLEKWAKMYKKANAKFY